MDEKTVNQALEQLKKETPKKGFKQSVELIISLKGFDVKKGDKIDDYVQLPNEHGKQLKFCALVGKELAPNAKQNCQTTIQHEEFNTWAAKPREIRKLVRKHDYFIAQLNIMPEIARVFGKYLGTKSKMPNPKLGLVLPPNGDVAPVMERLKKIVLLRTKNQPNIHAMIGTEDMDNAKLTKNAVTILEKISHDLPGGRQQIKGAYIKLTMSKPVRVG